MNYQNMDMYQIIIRFLTSGTQQTGHLRGLAFYVSGGFANVLPNREMTYQGLQAQRQKLVWGTTTTSALTATCSGWGAGLAHDPERPQTDAHTSARNSATSCPRAPALPAAERRRNVRTSQASTAPPGFFCLAYRAYSCNNDLASAVRERPCDFRWRLNLPAARLPASCAIFLDPAARPSHLQQRL